MFRDLGRYPAWRLPVGSYELLPAKQSSHNCADGAEDESEDCRWQNSLLVRVVCLEEVDGRGLTSEEVGSREMNLWGTLLLLIVVVVA